jgi:hypothetical protein
MLRWGLIIALAVLALLLAGHPAAQSRSHPRLALTTMSPLTVRGTGFHRRERVRVVASGGGTQTTRHVKARRSGGFVVSFAGHRPCGVLTVRATGSAGSRARLGGIRVPECMVH